MTGIRFEQRVSGSLAARNPGLGRVHVPVFGCPAAFQVLPMDATDVCVGRGPPRPTHDDMMRAGCWVLGNRHGWYTA
jgi:hypothetical protein